MKASLVERERRERMRLSFIEPALRFVRSKQGSGVKLDHKCFHY